MTFNEQEYTELFNAFEHVCNTLDAIKRLYVWPLKINLELYPEYFPAKTILIWLKEMENFINKSNLFYDEFAKVLKLERKESDQQ